MAQTCPLGLLPLAFLLKACKELSSCFPGQTCLTVSSLLATISEVRGRWLRAGTGVAKRIGKYYPESLALCCCAQDQMASIGLSLPVLPCPALPWVVWPTKLVLSAEGEKDIIAPYFPAPSGTQLICPTGSRMVWMFLNFRVLQELLSSCLDCLMTSSLCGGMGEACVHSFIYPPAL